MKLVVVTREDIHAGYQCVQSSHAIAEFIFQYPILAKQWKENSNYIICLSVKNLNDLEALSKKLRSKGYYVADFYEPDIDNQLTAFCVWGTAEVRKQFSHLPLTLKNHSTIKQNKSSIKEILDQELYMSAPYGKCNKDCHTIFSVEGKDDAVNHICKEIRNQKIQKI